MDRRDRLMVDDSTERVLIAYAADRLGDTKRIAEALADCLKRDNLAVELAEVDAAPPPQDYDAVVIGSHFRFGHRARDAVRYIKRYREALIAIPSFFFSVDDRDPRKHIAQFIDRTGWRPSENTTLNSHEDIHDFALRIAEDIPPAPVPSVL